MRFLICLILLLPLAATADQGAVSATLDKFHAAAANARFDDYFSLFTDDGWFLGTDASERWSVAEFKQYAKPAFDDGRGWRYDKLERNVMLSADGDLAWFDEILENQKLGRCRGTGVLRLEDGKWRIAHYSLTMLIPNEIAYDVGKKSKAMD